MRRLLFLPLLLAGCSSTNTETVAVPTPTLTIVVVVATPTPVPGPSPVPTTTAAPPDPRSFPLTATEEAWVKNVFFVCDRLPKEIQGPDTDSNHIVRIKEEIRQFRGQYGQLAVPARFADIDESFRNALSDASDSLSSADTAIMMKDTDALNNAKNQFSGFYEHMGNIRADLQDAVNESKGAAPRF